VKDLTNPDTGAMPSATVDEAKVAAWHALPRDEQVRRYRELLSSAACQTIVDDSMSDILAVARDRLAARRHG
jgi:hypothetical protein